MSAAERYARDGIAFRQGAHRDSCGSCDAAALRSILGGVVNVPDFDPQGRWSLLHSLSRQRGFGLAQAHDFVDSASSALAEWDVLDLLNAAMLSEGMSWEEAVDFVSENVSEARRRH